MHFNPAADIGAETDSGGCMRTHPWTVRVLGTFEPGGCIECTRGAIAPLFQSPFLFGFVPDAARRIAGQRATKLLTPEPKINLTCLRLKNTIAAF